VLLVHAEATPYAEWFSSLMRPDIGGSCCGETDQVYADEYWADGDGFVARVGSEKIAVPGKKVIWTRINPTGRGVLFYRHFNSGDYVYCFVPGSGV